MELAQEIYNLRAKKPIVAVVNSKALSAAYVAISGATEIVVTPSGEVGSVGVYAVHSDVSARDARDGVQYTFIKAGRFKTVGNPHEPLGTEAKDYLQRTWIVITVFSLRLWRATAESLLLRCETVSVKAVWSERIRPSKWEWRTALERWIRRYGALQQPSAVDPDDH